MKKLYYDWNTLYGYGLPITGCLGKRGIGKTFQPLRKCLIDYIYKKKTFAYFVENDTMVQDLCANNGEKFILAIIEHCRSNPSKINNKTLKILGVLNIDDKQTYQVKSGVLRVKGQIMGHILALSKAGEIKRGNYNVSNIIIDEFIPVDENAHNKKMPRQIVNVIQSVLRRRDAHMWLCANPINMESAVCRALQINKMKIGEKRFIHGKDGQRIGIFEYFDHNVLDEEARDNLAENLAYAFGMTQDDEGTEWKTLDENEKIVKGDLPPDWANYMYKICTNGEYLKVLVFDNVVHVMGTKKPKVTEFEKMKEFYALQPNDKSVMKYDKEFIKYLKLLYEKKRIKYTTVHAKNAFVKSFQK